MLCDPLLFEHKLAALLAWKKLSVFENQLFLFFLTFVYVFIRLTFKFENKWSPSQNIVIAWWLGLLPLGEAFLENFPATSAPRSY